MAKAYWVSTYFSVSNPEALAEYAKLAGPALAAGGRPFLARGTAAKAYEKGLTQRCVIIEFDSVEKAVAAHDGPGYQAALKALGNAAQRDIRIVEGLLALFENPVALQVDDLPRLAQREIHRVVVGRVGVGADEAVLLAHAADLARDAAGGLVLRRCSCTARRG